MTLSAFDRRSILKGGAALAATAALPRFAHAAATFAPKPEAWRTIELVTRLEVRGGEGVAKAWVPLPSFAADDWNRPQGSTFVGNGATTTIVRDPVYGAEMLMVEWKAGEPEPYVEIVSRLDIRDRAVDLTAPGNASALSDADRALYTRATDLIPVDGIVKETSDRIVGGATDDIEKARLIYAWMVDNTARNPKVRGCGIGDVAAMLRSGDLTGKCADLNALYVGLARAAGLPARDVYGLRVLPSRFGYKSLGTKNEVVTKAQHCRAEVWLSGHGWVPVDPADVRKVMLEEAEGGLPADDPKVIAARETLFGAWEGNWVAYNTAHDIALPGAAGPKVDFLMYPQAEVAAVRLDCLDPDTFVYTINATEVTM